MSAFLVGPDHISVMVRAAMEGHHSLNWTDEEGQRRELRALDYEEADRASAMLGAECRKSVAYRYPNDKPEELPGDQRPVGAIDWGKPHPSPTAVEVLKAIACYEYQSCEHPGWERSEAHDFCQALRHKVIPELPGYEKAPWDWSEETYREAVTRGGSISIMELRAARGR